MKLVVKKEEISDAIIVYSQEQRCNPSRSLGPQESFGDEFTVKPPRVFVAKAVSATGSVVVAFQCWALVVSLLTPSLFRISYFVS